MANYLNPWSGRQFVDANGAPYSGAKLFVYTGGSSTKTTVYKDSAGASQHANPIVLNTRGEPADTGGASQPIWQAGGAAVKFVLAPSTDTDPPVSPISTWDNIAGINDASVTVDQWASGPTPTYVGATSFTLIGDQTSTFHVGRRVKTTNSGGTIYGTITVSAYTTLTTITVVNDSGSLDVGLSAVSYGLLSATGPSVPGVSMSGSNWTHQGNITMSGKSVIEANASVAANATTSDIWSAGNYVTLTGAAVTFTNFAAAPQAGAAVELYCNDTHTFTNNANLVVDGATDFTAAIGDRIRVRARSTTVFELHPIRLTGKAVIGALTSGTYTATTSGTSIDFTGIPSWVKRITLQLVGVSTNGTSSPLIQIGDSGGIETTGYSGASVREIDSSSSAGANFTTGFGIAATSAANVIHGSVVLTLADAATFTWVASGTMALTNSIVTITIAGSKSLSATLDRIRLTTVNGTDAFDAGAVNILYE